MNTEQQIESLLNEIDEFKSQIALLEVQLKSSKQDVEILKSELKAADSVNKAILVKCGKCEMLGDLAPCDECYYNQNK